MELAGFEHLHDWLTVNSQWLGPVIGFVAFIESLLAVGFIVPGVAILFALAALAGSGLMEPLPMLLWAFAGAALGDGVSYQIGYHLRFRVRNCWPFRRHPQWLEQGEAFFHKYGGLSIAFGRFVGPIRPVIPGVAGMLGMSPQRFYVINLASSVPWALAYLMPGYLTGAAFQTDLPDGFYYLLLSLILTALLISSGGLLLDRSLSRRFSSLMFPAIFLVLCNIALCLLTALDVTEQLVGMNLKAQSFIHNVTLPVVNHIFSLITLFGSLKLLLLPVLGLMVWLLWVKKIRELVVLTAGFLGMEATMWLMKWGIDKPRPTHIDGLDQFSFPSGHTTQVVFVSLAVCLFCLAAQRRAVRLMGYSLALSASLLVALSRLILDVHWLGDTVAGLLLGAFWFAVVLVGLRLPEKRSMS